MKSVIVVFDESENIDSLHVDDPCMVNQIPGLITEVVNPPPPIIPTVPPGDYFCDKIELMRAEIVSGTHVKLHTKDPANWLAESLVLKSIIVNGYHYLDWAAEFNLPGQKLDNLNLSCAIKYSNWRGQYIYFFNYATGTWQNVNFQSVGLAIANIYLNIPKPANFISSTGQVKVRIFCFSVAAYAGYYDLVKLVIK